MNIDFDKLKYSLTGEYEEVMLEKQIEEKDKEIERLNKALLDIKEYIDNFRKYRDMEEYYQNYEFYDNDLKQLLDIVNKALGSDKE